MSLEGFQQEANKQELSKEEVFRARNEIQIKLAARFYGFEIEDEQFNEWITEYSSKFANLMTEHPEFLEKYVHGETDEVMEEVAEVLYESQGVEK